MRNTWTTLTVSQGTPLLSHGDEIECTELDNNSMHCQDSKLSEMDWSLVDNNADLLTFTRKTTRLRKQHPAFRRPVSSIE